MESKPFRSYICEVSLEQVCKPEPGIKTVRSVMKMWSRYLPLRTFGREPLGGSADKKSQSIIDPT